ncbi:MAG: hypothetical protein ACP5JW_07275 [Candidatus Bathyarchaeia archaeon]
MKGKKRKILNIFKYEKTGLLNEQTMGFIKAKFRIVNPMDRERHIDVEGVVDTGAI